MVVLHQRGAIVVAQHLERHAERAAIGQDTLMVIGQPSRPRIEIEVLVTVPGDGLRAAGLGHRVAAPQRPVAAAGARPRLQNQRLVAGFAQFVGQHHAGDPGPDDDDAPPSPWRQRGWPRIGRWHRQQSHRGHGVIGRGHAAGLANQVDERAAGEGHGVSFNHLSRRDVRGTGRDHGPAATRPFCRLGGPFRTPALPVIRAT